MCVGRLYASVMAGIGFIVEEGNRFQSPVPIEREKVVMGGTVAVSEGEDVGSVGVRIDGVELAHECTDGLVFAHGQDSAGVDIGWRMIGGN